jgi:Ice-binding-like
MNTANTIATFKPTAVNLNAGISYTATITTAAKNAGGTAIPKSVAWSFTTRAASSLHQASPFVGQAPVDLLTAGNFAILAGTAITEADPVTGTITGDIGLSGASGTFITVSCTEMLGGSKIHEDDAGGTDTCFVQSSPVVAQAILDRGTAYLEAANRSTPDATELGAGDISGLTIYPGLYKWATTGVGINTDVTLDAEGDSNAVWIFQISGDLAIAAGGGSVPAGIKVILANGAKASNIFWQVAASSAGATLNNYSTFNGNILSTAQVILGTGAVLNGRALAATQVTLIGNTVTQPAP